MLSTRNKIRVCLYGSHHTDILFLSACRSLSLSAHQQLSEQQKRLSQSEVEKCQLNTHIHTLKQAKDTLHGQ